jgi:hypothetical protein
VSYHLICVHEFHGYKKGQKITDPDEVERLRSDRDHHFVKISAPEESAAELAPPKRSAK